MFSGKILVKKFHVLSRKVVRYGRKASPVKKNKVNAKVLWSELDENLLGEIMSRLGLTDQARFHGVCKRWHSIRPVTMYKSLPWFVSFEKHPSLWSHSIKCCLYEPYSSLRSRISTYKISLSKFRVPYSLPTIFTVESKNNWLFTSVCQRNWFGPSFHKYFFVFSPFTRTVIQLPKLDYQLPMSSSFMHTFSTNPDSPDCVFFISNTCDEPEFVVLTCCQGDKEWTLRKFNNSVPGLCLAEYIYGTFFVVSPSGQLVSYNIMNGGFEIEKLNRDEDLDQLFDSQMDFFMFELNGELMIMYIGFRFDHVRRDNTTFPGIPCIKKFDWPTKAWIPIRSLGDQTLFVGYRILSVVKVGMEQARNMGVLSNAIYYYFDLGCIIYSFENGVLVQFKYNPASKNTVESGDILQDHCDSAIRDKNHLYFFLEPPVI